MSPQCITIIWNRNLDHFSPLHTMSDIALPSLLFKCKVQILVKLMSRIFFCFQLNFQQFQTSLGGNKWWQRSEFYQLSPEKENTVLVVLLHWIVIYPHRGTISLCPTEARYYVPNTTLWYNLQDNNNYCSPSCYGWGLLMLVTLLPALITNNNSCCQHHHHHHY